MDPQANIAEAYDIATRLQPLLERGSISVVQEYVGTPFAYEDIARLCALAIALGEQAAKVIDDDTTCDTLAATGSKPGHAPAVRRAATKGT